MWLDEQTEGVQAGVGCLTVLGVIAGLIFGVPWLWDAYNDAQDRQMQEDCEAMVDKMLAGEASENDSEWYYWNC